MSTPRPVPNSRTFIDDRNMRPAIAVVLGEATALTGDFQVRLPDAILNGVMKSKRIFEDEDAPPFRLVFKLDTHSFWIPMNSFGSEFRPLWELAVSGEVKFEMHGRDSIRAWNTASDYIERNIFRYTLISGYIRQVFLNLAKLSKILFHFSQVGTYENFFQVFYVVGK